MNPNLEELLSLGGPPLGPQLTRPPAFLKQPGKPGSELARLLLRKNGFFAFDRALHIFPVGPVSEGYDLERWNSHDLWRLAYGDMAENAFFFAEDIFGEQFCIRDGNGRVHRFDPETGRTREIASNLGEWAERIMVNYSLETGYILAHIWQQKNGPLPVGKRLLPIMPFIFGGKYELENLHATDAVEGMLFRAEIAHQIHDIPDGSTIRLVIKE